MRRPIVLAALFGALALILSGCPAQVPDELRAAELYECPPEECDPPQPVGEGGELVVEAFEFGFEIVEGTVAEGSIEISLTNRGEAEHDFVIDEAFGEVNQVPAEDYAPPGGTETETLELFAGEYTYYCSVPGHAAAGMEGVIEIPAEPQDAVDPLDPDVAEEGPAADPDEVDDDDGGDTDDEDDDGGDGDGEDDDGGDGDDADEEDDVDARSLLFGII